jgi:hypothetical protein
MAAFAAFRRADAVRPAVVDRGRGGQAIGSSPKPWLRPEPLLAPRRSSGCVSAPGECYLDFYCSPTQAEGTISERVATAMAELGRHGTGHGSEPQLIDFRTGESKVWRDGEWVKPDSDTN